MAENPHQLYRITSRIRNFLGHAGADVEILWFVVDRQEPVGPYDKLIEDYHEDETWAARSLNELFTASEAQAFKAYLLHKWGAINGSQITVTATAMPVPLSKDDLLARDVEVEGEWTFHKLSEEEGYALDFDVWGYYDASPLPDPGP